MYFCNTKCIFGFFFIFECNCKFRMLVSHTTTYLWLRISKEEYYYVYNKKKTKKKTKKTKKKQKKQKKNIKRKSKKNVRDITGNTSNKCNNQWKNVIALCFNDYKYYVSDCKFYIDMFHWGTTFDGVFSYHLKFVSFFLSLIFFCVNASHRNEK